jgi:hypothetical protein
MCERADTLQIYIRRYEFNNWKSPDTFAKIRFLLRLKRRSVATILWNGAILPLYCEFTSLPDPALKLRAGLTAGRDRGDLTL